MKDSRKHLHHTDIYSRSLSALPVKRGGSDLSCLHETESRRRRLGARLRRLGLRGRLAAGFAGDEAAAAAGFCSGRASLAVSLVTEP
ncbi:hypothetical protein F2Q70_00010949 [Brassica cretica]|uniref:Uncharacterized protein n=1 Tax=Brassica cretica TaxID=69181 RepID=A0A8S9LWK9_BRACR|nr:hypothetical protein F2Q70_00010949 [Brassica cretica]